MGLGSQDVATIFLALAALLGLASLLGEVARRFHQPAVVGEILAGVLLGPTVLGALAPGAQHALFPPSGPAAVVLGGFGTFAIGMFLVVAGMEVDLSSVWRQGRTAVAVSVLGVVFPFALAFVAAWLGPDALGREPGHDRLIFALFFGTALSISALPVIAKILRDLDLLRTDFGMLVLASATVQDLAGWLVFAVILGMMGAGASHHLAVPHTVALTVAFAAFTLTVVRWAVHRALPWIQAHASWPGGPLGFAVTLALVCGAVTEWIGVHAIFGTFLAGVAVGDSRHLRERTRAVLDQFISFIFAPLFFASIGLRVDFARHLDLGLALAVCALAVAGKVVGCGLGARLGGATAREAWAIAWAMNARGAMEVILGLLAREAGVIGDRLFVALVVMAVVTSVASGPAVQRALARRRVRRFTDHVPPGAFVRPLAEADRAAAVDALAATLAAPSGLAAGEIAAAVMAREALMPTGLEHGVAIPHARLEGLRAPLVAVGVAADGVDFDAPDGSLARLVFLILTPEGDAQPQLEIIADIAATFRQAHERDAGHAARTLVEFVAVVRTA